MCGVDCDPLECGLAALLLLTGARSADVAFGCGGLLKTSAWVGSAWGGVSGLPRVDGCSSVVTVSAAGCWSVALAAGTGCGCRPADAGVSSCSWS